MNKNLTTTLSALSIAGLLAMSSCNNTTTSTTSTDSTSSMSQKMDTGMKHMDQAAQTTMTDAKNAMSTGNPDSNFVVKATIANNQELKLLQDGVDKGTDKELKMHAKMMINDHKMLGDKVKAYAAKKNYTLPTGDMGKAPDVEQGMANVAKGKDWDKAFTDQMVNDHQDVISLFESNKDKVKDAELQGMITAALPTLNNHLQMVKGMQDKMK